MLTDAQLMAKLQAGDDASFETLFLRHYERIYRLLYQLLGNRADAEDIAQQVFLKLYHAPHRLRLDDDDHNVVGWLYRVATNEGYNALRSQKRRTRRHDRFARLWPANDALPDPVRAVEQADTRTMVHQALTELKPRQAKLLLLRYSGLSYKELAVALNVAPGSIGSLLNRAERAFQKKYSQLAHHSAVTESE